jgi:cytochrome c-type biogenesis protein CcmH
MTDGKPSGSRIGLIVLAVAAVAAAAGLGYRAWHGGESNAPAAQESGAALTIDELEARARANPKDSKAWQALALAYMDRERYPEAGEAWRHAAENDPQNASLWASMGEALTYASKDPAKPMPPAASAAFHKAFDLDPTEPRARYFLAVEKDLKGDHQGAIDDWLALLKDTPAGAPWEASLRQTIDQVGKINKIDTAKRIAEATAGRPMPALSAGDAIPGPSQQQIAAATAIPPSEQRTMAEGMVAQLEGKLKSNPTNVDGWVMLMRSRMTLGQPDKASQALKDAIAANPTAKGRLLQEAGVLGVR